MSLLFGIWHYHDCGQIALSLKEMYTGIQAIPCDNHVLKKEQQIGFGQIVTYNTPDCLFERGPMYLSDEQIFFLAQGRVDNREGLKTALGFKSNEQQADSWVMLKSYLRWGKNCIDHLRGDWSFAVFDYKSQELFIAQSPTGYTSLYYYQDQEGFFFSSSIKSILNLSSYSKRLNELHFVRGLTLWDHTKAPQETYFKDIFSLPTGHSLTVKGVNVNVQRYWYPQKTPLTFYKAKQEYADKMLELFTTAIEKQLRSHKQVASTLSGGLDSSTVAFVAADLLRSKNVPLTTLSHIPLFTNEILSDKENTYKVLDETPFILEIVRASGNIHPLLLRSDNYSVLEGMIDILNISSGPIHGASNAYWLLDIYKNTAKRGFGTLLKGEGGNGSISFAGLDYLLPVNLSSFLSHPYHILKRRVGRPFKAYVKQILRLNDGVTKRMEEYTSNVFLKQVLIEEYEIIKNIRANGKKYNPIVKNINERKQLFLDLYNYRSLVGAACGHFYGIELRDPTIDADLMEYFFSIPNEVFFDEQFNNRMLVKRMMKGRIPDKVLFEKKGGLQSSDIVYRVKAQVNEITEAINSVSRSPVVNHYMDTKKLSETYQQYLQQPYVEPYEMQRLLKSLHFALFLQMHFD